MILQRVEQPDWLSNAYLVVDEPGGHGVLVDSNGVTEPLVERVEREGTTITHVLLTHHHSDHVVDAEKLAERFGVPVLAHEKAAELLDGQGRRDDRRGRRDRVGRAADRAAIHHGPARPAAAGPHRRDGRRDRRRRPVAARRAGRRRARRSAASGSRSTRCSRGSRRRSPSAQASEERLRRFLADASHELRTPLASIRGYAELFRIGAAREPGGRREGDAPHRGRGRAHGRARRGPAGARPPRRGPRAGARARRPRGAAARRGRRRPRRPRPTATIALARRRRRASSPATRDQLRQVLANLAAQRARPHAGRARRSRSPCARATASVAARGPRPRPGPAATDDPAALFERFWRAEPGRERGRAGAGLGLAIVAAIVDRARRRTRGPPTPRRRRALRRSRCRCARAQQQVEHCVRPARLRRLIGVGSDRACVPAHARTGSPLPAGIAPYKIHFKKYRF